MDEKLIELGAVAVIFLWSIKEFFSYLKSRKEVSNGESTIATNGLILKELQLMNNNHLHSLKDAIELGNTRVVGAINEGNIRQIELLGEIKGQLSK